MLESIEGKIEDVLYTELQCKNVVATSKFRTIFLIKYKNANIFGLLMQYFLFLCWIEIKNNQFVFFLHIWTICFNAHTFNQLESIAVWPLILKKWCLYPDFRIFLLFIIPFYRVDGNTTIDKAFNLMVFVVVVVLCKENIKKNNNNNINNCHFDYETDFFFI